MPQAHDADGKTVERTAITLNVRWIHDIHVLTPYQYEPELDSITARCWARRCIGCQVVRRQWRPYPEGTQRLVDELANYNLDLARRPEWRARAFKPISGWHRPGF